MSIRNGVCQHDYCYIEDRGHPDDVGSLDSFKVKEAIRAALRSSLDTATFSAVEENLTRDLVMNIRRAL